MSRIVQSLQWCLIFSLPSVWPLCLAAEVIFLPPTPYLSSADSPFEMSELGTTFFFEDFEDGTFDLPLGVASWPGVVNGPGSLTDSVDGDDGVIDGSGTGGHSFTPTIVSVLPTNPPQWQVPLRFDFDESVLGFSPHAFGFAWTDGVATDFIWFPSSLGISVEEVDGTRSHIRFDSMMGQSQTGETEEDVFLGVTSDIGIRWALIWHKHQTSTFENHFEIDHLQFGLLVPEPVMSWLSLAAALILLWRVPIFRQQQSRKESI